MTSRQHKLLVLVEVITVVIWVQTHVSVLQMLCVVVLLSGAYEVLRKVSSEQPGRTDESHVAAK